jgi:hypothetical protein
MVASMTSLSTLAYLRAIELQEGEENYTTRSFHNLYSSPSIIRIIKSRRMRWAGHVARMGEKRNVYRILVSKPKEKRPL